MISYTRPLPNELLDYEERRIKMQFKEEVGAWEMTKGN